jgi:hypothetical protein
MHGGLAAGRHPPTRESRSRARGALPSGSTSVLPEDPKVKVDRQLVAKDASPLVTSSTLGDRWA